MRKKKISQKIIIVLATIFLFFDVSLFSVFAVGEQMGQELNLSVVKTDYHLNEAIQVGMSIANTTASETTLAIPTGLEFNQEETQKLVANGSNTVIKTAEDLTTDQAQVVSETTKTVPAPTSDTSSEAAVTNSGEAVVDANSDSAIAGSTLPPVQKSEDEQNKKLVVTYYQKQREIVIKNYTEQSIEMQQIVLTATQLGDYSLQSKQGNSASNNISLVVKDETAIPEPSDSSATVDSESIDSSSQVTADSSATADTSAVTESEAPDLSGAAPSAKPVLGTKGTVTVDPGWTKVANNYYGSIPLTGGQTAYYGFTKGYGDALSADLIQTDSYIKDKSGKRVDYMFHNFFNNTQQRFFISELVNVATPTPHQELKYTKVNNAIISLVETKPVPGGDATKGPFIVQAVGFLRDISGTGSAATVKDEFKVYSIITPNITDGTLEYTTRVERLRSPSETSAYGDSVGFAKLVDTKLNGNDAVDVKYSSMNKGMYIEDSPYKVNFDFLDVSMGPAVATNWNSASFYNSGKLTSPSDFFPGWNEATGAEKNNGKPGEVINHAADSGIGMKWDVEALAKGSARNMSYRVYLGDTKAPTMKVTTKDINVNVEDTISINGTWNDVDSPWANLSYSIDGGAQKVFRSKMPNATVGKDNAWTQTFRASELGSGSHKIAFFATDNTGITSTVVEATVTINSSDGYLFSKTYTKSGSPDKTAVGDVIHYKVVLANVSGHDWETGISDDLPTKSSGLTVDNKTIAVTVADGTKYFYADKDTPGNQGLWMVYDGAVYFAGSPIKDGKTIQLEFNAVVNENAAGKDTLTNHASTSIINKAGKGEDIETEVSLAGSVIESLPVADISQTYKDMNLSEDGFSQEGNAIDYSVHIGNKIQDVKIQDLADTTWYSMTGTETLPEGLSYVDGSIQILDSTGKDITSTANVENGNISYETSANNLTIKLEKLAYKDFITVNFKGKIASGTAGKKLTNTIDVNGVSINGTKVTGSASTTIETIVRNKNIPTITLDNKEETSVLHDYQLKGTWTDENSKSDTLYYQIDGQTPVAFSKNIANATPGQATGWDYTIPASDLTTGDHTIAVYATGDSGLSSSTASVIVHFSGALSFKVAPPETTTFNATKISNEVEYVGRSGNWDMIVEDTLGKGSSWRLNAQLDEEFTDSQTKKTLPNALVYIDAAGTETAMDVGQLIDISSGIVDSDIDFPISWQEDQGMLLKVDPGSYTGHYQGTIDWILTNAP
ncbi:hypothetical protein ACWOFR_05640 [Carnobacterium gallinarum]|uniref:hypothetical protein n=1 Tax=Carnobacterium gallinarum TaxID=2749 RepID=UPI00054D8337|nr:hypothetical protein [Carnobacterium gallinarum]